MQASTYFLTATLALHARRTSAGGITFQGIPRFEAQGNAARVHEGGAGGYANKVTRHTASAGRGVRVEGEFGLAESAQAHSEWYLSRAVGRRASFIYHLCTQSKHALCTWGRAKCNVHARHTVRESAA